MAGDIQMRAVTLLAVALLPAFASAQQVPATAERVVAIKAGRLIDVTNGAVLENVTIVVRASASKRLVRM
jgi:D-alanyl-D-alanine carboxypeptidase